MRGWIIHNPQHKTFPLKKNMNNINQVVSFVDGVKEVTLEEAKTVDNNNNKTTKQQIKNEHV
jgi:hypothetical protein